MAIPASRVAARGSSRAAAQYSASAASTWRGRGSGELLEPRRDPIALGLVAALVGEPSQPAQDGVRPRLDLLGAAVQLQGARVVAEVALGDLGDPQQQRPRDAGLGLAAPPLDQRQQPIGERFGLARLTSEREQRLVELQPLRRAFHGQQMGVEGLREATLPAQALGQLGVDVGLRRRPRRPRQPLFEQAAEHLVVAAREQGLLQAAGLLGVLEGSRQGRLEQLVGLAAVAARAREPEQPQQDPGRRRSALPLGAPDQQRPVGALGLRDRAGRLRHLGELLQDVGVGGVHRGRERELLEREGQVPFGPRQLAEALVKRGALAALAPPGLLDQREQLRPGLGPTPALGQPVGQRQAQPLVARHEGHGPFQHRQGAHQHAEAGVDLRRFTGAGHRQRLVVRLLAAVGQHAGQRLPGLRLPIEPRQALAQSVGARLVGQRPLDAGDGTVTLPGRQVRGRQRPGDVDARRSLGHGQPAIEPAGRRGGLARRERQAPERVERLRRRLQLGDALPGGGGAARIGERRLGQTGQGGPQRRRGRPLPLVREQRRLLIVDVSELTGLALRQQHLGEARDGLGVPRPLGEVGAQDVGRVAPLFEQATDPHDLEPQRKPALAPRRRFQLGQPQRGGVGEPALALVEPRQGLARPFVGGRLFVQRPPDPDRARRVAEARLAELGGAAQPAAADLVGGREPRPFEQQRDRAPDALRPASADVQPHALVDGVRRGLDSGRAGRRRPPGCRRGASPARRAAPGAPAPGARRTSPARRRPPRAGTRGRSAARPRAAAASRPDRRRRGRAAAPRAAAASGRAPARRRAPAPAPRRRRRRPDSRRGTWRRRARAARAAWRARARRRSSAACASAAAAAGSAPASRASDS